MPVVGSLCCVLVWCIDWYWLSGMNGSCVWVIASVVRRMVSSIRVSGVVFLLFRFFVCVGGRCCCVFVCLLSLLLSFCVFSCWLVRRFGSVSVFTVFCCCWVVLVFIVVMFVVCG